MGTPYGGKLAAHGLRSIASTTLNEQGFNADVIESVLAHSDRNEVRKAYNHSIYLMQKADMMNCWGTQVKKEIRHNETYKIHGYKCVWLYKF